jgi:Beta-1,4-xylanase
MKSKFKILPLAALAVIVLGFNSCYDEKMEWGHDYGGVAIAEMPLDLAEKLANYDFIKAYAEKYTPNMSIGLGLDASLYVSDAKYRKIANDNFQSFTAGNEMKHSSVVRADGTFNFATIEKFFEAVPADKKIYGHNYVWHKQQRAEYLNRLIAPVTIPPTAGSNVLDISGLEDGSFTGWNKANNAAGISIEEGKGLAASDPAIKFVVTAGGNEWDTQLTSPGFDAIEGHAYMFSFWIRSEEDEDVSFRVSFANMSNNYPWYDGSNMIPTNSTWKQVTYGINKDLKATGTPVKMSFDMGKKPGTYYVDINSIKVIDLDAPAELNYVENGDFETGDLTNWTAQNPGDGITVVDTEKHGGQYSVQLISSATSAAEWDVQFRSDELPLTTGTTYVFSFFIKSNIPGQARVSFPGNENEWPWMNWLGSGAGALFTTTGGTWDFVSVDFTPDIKTTATGVKLSFDLGKTPGVTYWLDDVKVVEKEVEPEGVKPQRIISATIDKTPEEKKEIILGELEKWIKTMAEYCKHRVTDWDVLNEVIGDGGLLRGVDNVPTEVAADEFYWGQYIGKEYGVKAFQFARQYGNPTDKLYINDYNLESSNPNKLNKLIEYVNYIDETNGSPIVDGLGTQLHVDANSITKGQIDNMFKTMAATGKLVRITELDVKLGTPTPSVELLEKQAQVYQMIIESYKENVPAAQQSGITVWTLSDNKKEHEYWIPDNAPNLFDANYGRKHAYKTFCDAIAGYDISTDFDGEDYVKIYEEETE